MEIEYTNTGLFIQVNLSNKVSYWALSKNWKNTHSFIFFQFNPLFLSAQFRMIFLTILASWKYYIFHTLWLTQVDYLQPIAEIHTVNPSNSVFKKKFHREKKSSVNLLSGLEKITEFIRYKLLRCSLLTFSRPIRFLFSCKSEVVVSFMDPKKKYKFSWNPVFDIHQIHVRKC